MPTREQAWREVYDILTLVSPVRPEHNALAHASDLVYAELTKAYLQGRQDQQKLMMMAPGEGE